MSTHKDITIYDIAEALNLSPATVSRGLKEHPSIRKDTRKKILEKAKEMGYRQNFFASNLRRNRTNTIGVIVPRLNSYFMSTVIAGMEKIANQAGYNLIISQSMESIAKEVVNVKTLYNTRVDGLLVSLAYATDDISHFEELIEKGVPLIFFDRVFEHPQCTNIVIDNDLMDEALELTGLKTKRETVELGLKTLIRLRKQERIRQLKGNVRWEGDLEAMRADL